MSEHTTCVVVGGGPAGMVLGSLLARAGIEVSVLEKHGDFLRDFRGNTVHPSTLQLLDELGLSERFAKLPSSVVPAARKPQDNPSALMPYAARGRFVIVVPREDFLQLGYFARKGTDAQLRARGIERFRQDVAVTPATLARVRTRRLLPTIVTQLLQQLLHRTIAAPIPDERRTGPPEPFLALLRYLPQASFVPASLIGIGLRPEHAPDFARRPAPTS